MQWKVSMNFPPLCNLSHRWWIKKQSWGLWGGYRPILKMQLFEHGKLSDVQCQISTDCDKSLAGKQVRASHWAVCYNLFGGGVFVGEDVRTSLAPSKKKLEYYLRIVEGSARQSSCLHFGSGCNYSGTLMKRNGRNSNMPGNSGNTSRVRLIRSRAPRSRTKKSREVRNPLLHHSTALLSRPISCPPISALKCGFLSSFTGTIV